MTQTLEPTTTAEPSAARRRVETWLADFEAALAARDAERAAGLFATTSFWRDLIAFSWNLTTVENRDGVEPTCSGTRWRRPTPRTSGSPTARSPTRPAASRRPGSTFETAVGRGSGLLRLNDEGAWTFLTTLDELKGHEENQGATRPKGVEHGARKDRVTWKERRAAEVDGLGRDRDPDVLVIGGGQGGIALGARLRQLGVEPPRRRPARAPRRPVAQPLQVALPARPRLVRPPALPAVPAQLAGLRAEGQDRRLARDVHADHGDQLLGLHDREERHLGRREEGVDGHRRPRRRGGRAAPQAARLRPRGVGQAEHPDAARPGRLPRASSTTAPSTRVRTTTRTRRSSSSARTTRRSTSAGRCGRSAPTSRWCSAAPPTSSGRTP